MFYTAINSILRCSFVWFYFTVVIERAVSDERKSLIFRYCVNAVVGDNSEKMLGNLLVFLYRMNENALIGHQIQMWILNWSDTYW